MRAVFAFFLVWGITLANGQVYQLGISEPKNGDTLKAGEFIDHVISIKAQEDLSFLDTMFLKYRVNGGPLKNYWRFLGPKQKGTWVPINRALIGYDTGKVDVTYFVIVKRPDTTIVDSLKMQYYLAERYGSDLKIELLKKSFPALDTSTSLSIRVTNLGLNNIKSGSYMKLHLTNAGWFINNMNFRYSGPELGTDDSTDIEVRLESQLFRPPFFHPDTPNFCIMLVPLDNEMDSKERKDEDNVDCGSLATAIPKEKKDGQLSVAIFDQKLLLTLPQSSAEPLSLALYSLSGRLIHTGTVPANTIRSEFSIPTLPGGIALLKVWSHETSYQSKVFNGN